MTRAIRRALFVGLMSPCVLAAQEGQSIFSVLDTGDRSIGPAPALAQGSLSEGDLLTYEGRRVQAWQIAAGPGDELQVDLRSDDFDAYVFIVGPGLGGGLYDDDGGEDLDSRICLAVEAAGEYRVIAASLSGETGDFTLEVRPRDGATSGTCPEVAETVAEVTDASELPIDGRVLSLGGSGQGSLDADDALFLGSPAEAWQLVARAGAPLTVDLVSDDFDAYLELEGPGLDDVLSDDDGGGRCNARITLTPSENGTYLVVVSTLGDGRGDYRLAVSAEPGFADPASCLEVEEATTGGTDDPEAVTVVGALEVGGSRSGAMTGSDSEYAGSHFQAWTLDARAGDRLAIENISEDFDSYLYLVGPGFPDPIYDDDGAGSLDSRICVEIPESATYRVLAGPFYGDQEGGRYTVRVVDQGIEELCPTLERTAETRARILAELDTQGRALTVGQTREGTLDPAGSRHPDTDRVVQAWSLELDTGTEVTVDLESNEFDPVLYVLGPGLDEPIYVDDAGGGVCNSRIAFTPSASGTFRVLAGAYYEGGGGAFTLRASIDPPEIAQGGCISPDTTVVGANNTVTTTDSGPLASLSTGREGLLQVGTEIEASLDADDETLTTGEPAEPWLVDLRAGDEVVFELLSDDFDCILFVDDGSGSPLRDDDSAGNLDSRVVYTAAADVTVRVVVSALSAGNSGTFRLRAIRRVP
ncbi:MAG: hypothetical protein ABL963_00010 [Longimicrobiales bacterium]